MSKLHWFKFDASKWLSGRISKLDYSDRGVFIDLLCRYWVNDLQMTVEDVRLDYGNSAIDRLIDRRILKVADDMLSIEFLDDQYHAFQEIREKRSEAGSKGGKQRQANAKQEPSNSLANSPKSQANSSRGEEIREDKIKEESIDAHTPSKFNFTSELKANGADAKLVSEWMQVRRQKKAANTETALKKFLNEVSKSGMTIDQVLTLCIEKSWKGFEASWDGVTSMNKSNNNNAPTRGSFKIGKL